MTWPKTLARTTKHKKPRHQLYQPGFNESNGCWLEGSWVSVPRDEWDARKAEHLRMYDGVREVAGEQDHHGPPVPRDKMTRAQRQAWQHYSGSAHFDCVHDSGRVGPVGVEMQGNRVDARAARWMRAEGWKIIRFVTGGDGERRDQTAGMEIPDELLADRGSTPEEAVDTWQHVVDQNVGQMDDLFNTLLNAAVSDDPGPPAQATGMDYRGFATQMAFTSLVQQEESIIRMEWNERQGDKDRFRTLQQEIDRYVDMRRRLKAEAASPEVFDAWYREARESHNSCARANLDNTDGRIYSYVLPEFNDDGTHEPWGPRDVPWGQEKAP